MPSPAPLRSPVVRSTLALLLVLGGCGNRGELYLEAPLDADVEAEIERLGSTVPDPGAAPDAFPLLPGDGVAPTPAPDLDSPTDAVPSSDAEPAASGDASAAGGERPDDEDDDDEDQGDPKRDDGTGPRP